MSMRPSTHIFRLARQELWVVTSFGAVLHDSGGYGMLGFGHCVETTQKILGANHVMANVMTASPSHHRLCAALDAEIGHTRQSHTHVYGRYMFLNSGSEALSLAARIADLNTKNRITAKQKLVRSLSFAHSFHGRTERPARLSDSCRPVYRQHLHSFASLDDIGTLKHNDVQGLRQAFADAERDGVFIDAMYFEPISGRRRHWLPLITAVLQSGERVSDQARCVVGHRLGAGWHSWTWGVECGRLP